MTIVMNTDNPEHMMKVTIVPSTWKVVQVGHPGDSKYYLMEWKDTTMIGSITFQSLNTLNSFIKDNDIQCKCDHLT
jgi:hypothetical protein